MRRPDFATFKSVAIGAVLVRCNQEYVRSLRHGRRYFFAASSNKSYRLFKSSRWQIARILSCDTISLVSMPPPRRERRTAGANRRCRAADQCRQTDYNMLRTFFFGLALTLAAPTVGAQSYPSRPIKIIVSAAAGGTLDILARSVAQKLGEQLSQSVIVENRGGASGIVGTEMVAKAEADGYTIGLIPDPAFTIYPHVYEKLPFTVDDFEPITEGATTALGIFAHSSIQVSTLHELIALAKLKPDSLSFGTPGTGTPMHLAGELLKQVAGFNMVHVPYKGGAPAMNDAVAGQIPVLIAGLGPVLPFVQSGHLKALAITDSKRSALAPDVPTVAESGLPGFQVTTWSGFFTSAGTPLRIIGRLNREILIALRSPDLPAKMLKAGLEVSGSTPEELAARTRADSQHWLPVVRTIGLRLEQ
jgi:tripartite-type tricarboxylate transporter receptor subunit TctC